MIENMKVLALIPARAGSKGIKRKNMIELCGRPLISYSIQAGLGSRYVDEVVVTTDSEEIADIAKSLGAQAPFLRPKELASDKARTIDAVLHAVEQLELRGKHYDILVLLQPTQPLRLAEDIDGALERFMEGGMEALASVKKVEEHPVLMRTIDGQGTLKGLLPLGSTMRRQEMPAYYLVDGSIYINKVAQLRENTSFNDNPRPYLIPRERSVDIDEPRDLKLAELSLMQEGDGK